MAKIPAIARQSDLKFNKQKLFSHVAAAGGTVADGFSINRFAPVRIGGGDALVGSARFAFLSLNLIETPPERVPGTRQRLPAEALPARVRNAVIKVSAISGHV